MLRKNKRFIFFLGYACPFPGAGWWRTYNLAKNFALADNDCTIFSSFSYTPTNFRNKTFTHPRIQHYDGIKICNFLPFIELDHPGILFLNNFISGIFSIPILLLSRADTLVLSIPPIDQIFPILFASKMLKKDVIIDYRDELEDFLIAESGKWSFFYRFLKSILTVLYRNSRLVIPVTPAVAEGLQKRSISNVKIIYDGVDTKTFRPLDKGLIRSELSIPKEAFVIAFVGNIYNPYRLDIVVKAIKKLNDRNTHEKYVLVFVGGGKVKSILELSKTLNATEYIKYFGLLKRPADVAKILNCADCGVIPYDDNPLWEKTFSTKLFEYCAVGLPILGTARENSALANVVKTNDLGLVVVPLKIDEVILAIDKLSSNYEARNRMRLSALNFAKRYEKQRLALDLLNELKKTSNETILKNR